MFDGELIEKLVVELTAAMTSAKETLQFPDFEVVQKAQPTQQGTSTKPVIFFQKLFDIPRGWPATDWYLDNVARKYVEITRQHVETTFQISSLHWQNPELDHVVTAADIANYVRAYFQARSTIQRVKELDFLILRVSHISNEAFENDKHQFEFHPSFDMVVTYNQYIRLHENAAYSADEVLIGI
ncbi:hypothetical protein [Pseudomonas phage TH15]|uniref:Phage protein n=1 Tax=Pseudomonas phage TH15 TaxID=2801839 RepID=A0A7T7Z825_9CAUD|nr:hypothetical protein [Pseudomonas phage TH15]